MRQARCIGSCTHRCNVWVVPHRGLCGCAKRYSSAYTEGVEETLGTRQGWLLSSSWTCHLVDVFVLSALSPCFSGVRPTFLVMMATSSTLKVIGSQTSSRACMMRCLAPMCFIYINICGEFPAILLRTEQAVQKACQLFNTQLDSNRIYYLFELMQLPLIAELAKRQVGGEGCD